METPYSNFFPFFTICNFYHSLFLCAKIPSWQRSPGLRFKTSHSFRGEWYIGSLIFPHLKRAQHPGTAKAHTHMHCLLSFVHRIARYQQGYLRCIISLPKPHFGMHHRQPMPSIPFQQHRTALTAISPCRSICRFRFLRTHSRLRGHGHNTSAHNDNHSGAGSWHSHHCICRYVLCCVSCCSPTTS